MTIKNGDKSAMPTHDVFEDCGIDGNSGPHLTQTTSYGLTKREMIAMHMMAALTTNYGRYTGFEQVNSRLAVSCADALLEELERTK